MNGAMEPMHEVALGFGLAVLAAGLVGIIAATRLPSLRSRAVAALAVATVAPFAALLVSGILMLDTLPETPFVIVVIGAVLIAVVAAVIIIRGAVRPLTALSSAAERLAGGELSARVPLGGLRETDELARSFNEMAASIETLFDARSQLVAWASHDLRTPLASMQVMLEAIEDGVAEPEEYLPGLSAQVQRMTILVADLLELASIDAAQVGTATERVHVRELLESLAVTFGPRARAADITLDADELERGLELRCQVSAVERVLGNLIDNALRHTPAGGTVVVRADSGPQAIVFTVSDSGSGFEHGEHERAFERFYRGDRARTSPGAGLGLAIARGLVEAHGGTITAEDGPLGGAIVTVTLPTGELTAHTAPVLTPVP